MFFVDSFKICYCLYDCIIYIQMGKNSFLKILIDYQTLTNIFLYVIIIKALKYFRFILCKR